MDGQRQLKKKSSRTRDYTWIRAAIIWGVGLILIRLILERLSLRGWFIFQDFWPMTIVWPKHIRWYDGLTIGAMVALMGWFVRRFRKMQMGMFMTIIGGLSLLSALLQGYFPGLVYPITGMNRWDATYWNESGQIAQVSSYLSNYVWQQPVMNYHARVHPPGPTVMVWTLRQIENNPLWVGGVFWAVGLLSVWLVYVMVAQNANEQMGRVVAALWGLSPFFLIYAWVSFDMVIVTLFLTVVYFWLQNEQRGYFWGTVVSLFVAAMSTFGVVWLLFLLGLMDWWRKKSLRHWLAVFGLMGVLLIGFRWLSGYDYVASFQVASRFEGLMNGALPLTAPLAYLVSRIQGILEPIVYLGPIGSLLLWHLLTFKNRGRLFQVARAGLISMGVFLASGAYYTGETARAAMFVIPVVMMGWTAEFSRWKTARQNLLLKLFFSQGLLMQVLLFFHW